MPGTVAPTRPSWKNGLRGEVLARTLVATTVVLAGAGAALAPALAAGADALAPALAAGAGAVLVTPPMRTASGPVMTGAAPSSGVGRSLAARCFHSGRSPVVVGTAQ